MHIRKHVPYIRTGCIFPDSKKKLPFKGRTLATTKFLLPVIEKLLDMPDAGLEEGSDEWIKSMKENLDMVTFTHMNRYPELLRQWVKHEIDRGCSQGVRHSFVKIRSGEKIPSGVYESKDILPGSVLKGTRRHMHFHVNLEYLRSGAVRYSLAKLREAALYPRAILSRTLPKHASNMDNFAKVVHTFTAHYCFAQGIPRSSDLTRNVQLYLCYGKGKMESKSVPVMSIIHKKLQTGLHRFTGSVRIKTHWADLIRLIERNPGSYHPITYITHPNKS